MGLFTTSLFILLASLYLIGEADDSELKARFIARAKIAAILAILIGPFVFLTAEWSNFALYERFVSNWVSVGSFALATLLLIPFWRSMTRRANSVVTRGFGVGIALLVLLGCFGSQYPTIIRVGVGNVVNEISFSEAAAPDATLSALKNSLLFGALLILPALGYLFTIFKWETLEQPESKNSND